jgi:membrane-associated phospholipid phosphatase
MAIRPKMAALGAGGCVVMLAVVWFAAFHIGFLAHANASVFLQFGDLGAHRRAEWVAWRFVSPFDPNPYVYLALVPVAVAVLRGRPRSALAVVAIMLGANVTTELLKHVLSEPSPSPLLPAPSWPSGHATAAMSLVLASVLAVPTRLRPAAAAFGASLAIAVGYSVIATGMHYPSDVVGGFLVAAAWTLLTVAALLAGERWRPTSTPGAGPISMRAVLGAPGIVLLGALLMTALVVLIRPHDVFSYARAHEAFLVGAAGIGALGLGLSTGVVLSVRR